MALKKPQPDQKGLKKLPTHVRNKMGYMKDGGKVPDDNFTMMIENVLSEVKSEKETKKRNKKIESAIKKMDKLVDKTESLSSDESNQVSKAIKKLQSMQKSDNKRTDDLTMPQLKNFQSGGMIGAADMSAKKTSAPKKKKMPQYYMGGGMIKKNKPYAYGGRVAKYKD